MDHKKNVFKKHVKILFGQIEGGTHPKKVVHSRNN